MKSKANHRSDRHKDSYNVFQFNFDLGEGYSMNLQNSRFFIAMSWQYFSLVNLTSIYCPILSTVPGSVLRGIFCTTLQWNQLSSCVFCALSDNNRAWGFSEDNVNFDKQCCFQGTPEYLFNSYCEWFFITWVIFICMCLFEWYHVVCVIWQIFCNVIGQRVFRFSKVESVFTFFFVTTSAKLLVLLRNMMYKRRKMSVRAKKVD